MFRQLYLSRNPSCNDDRLFRPVFSAKQPDCNAAGRAGGILLPFGMFFAPAMCANVHKKRGRRGLIAYIEHADAP